MLKQALLASAVFVASATLVANAATPRPQMIQYLWERAEANNAQDYLDCLPDHDYCEKGKVWTIKNTHGMTETWKISAEYRLKTEANFRPFTVARMIRTGSCADEVRWDLDRGVMLYRFEGTPNANGQRWNQIDMDFLNDQDRAAYPSTGQNEACPFHGLQIQFQRWDGSCTRYGFAEAMISVRNTSLYDYAELAWSCDLYDQDNYLVGRGSPVVFYAVPKNAITTDTKLILANGMFQRAQCTLVHAEKRSHENERLQRGSSNQTSWPDRGHKHWWNFNSPVNGEARPDSDVQW